jgi:hypothetical protein
VFNFAVLVSGYFLILCMFIGSKMVLKMKLRAVLEILLFLLVVSFGNFLDFGSGALRACRYAHCKIWLEMVLLVNQNYGSD